MGLPKLLSPDPDSGREGKRGKRFEAKELLMLLALDRRGPMGRYRLKEITGLREHEGLVKQMLAQFQRNGYISASRSGCTLTEKGRTFLKNSLKTLRIREIKPFDVPLLRAGPISIGAQLEDVANKISSAMEIRDIAVRGGATGATIMLYRGGKLVVPSVDPGFLSENLDLSEHIQDSFELKEEDVIAIVSAEDEWIGFEASIKIAEALRHRV